MRIILSTLLLFVFPATIGAQAWSGILSSSRAMDWTHAGLPATLPDGETTPNPWTPPTRTQCGSTISSGASPATINAALAGCGAGTYVLLGPGTFTINSNITLYAQNGVTLRGSGGSSTILNLSGSAQIQFGVVWSDGSASWTAGYSQGATSLTMASPSGPTLTAGALAYLTECDTGVNGSCPTSQQSYDNGGLYICGGQTICQVPGEYLDSTLSHQQQTVYVTSVTGSGPYTVNFTPGLYMPNWSSANSPTIKWIGTTSGASTVSPYGAGLEDLTVNIQSGYSANQGITMEYTYASWVKGVRIIGTGTSQSVKEQDTKNCLFANNLVYAEWPQALDNNLGLTMQQGQDSDDLTINNIFQVGILWEGTGGMEGDVFAYNYGRDSQAAYYESVFQHNAGGAFVLYDSNELPKLTDDATHGTHSLSTFFRNYLSGYDPPFVSNSTGVDGLSLEAFDRFENAVGNVIGNTNPSSTVTLSTYESTQFNSVNSNFVYRFGYTNGQPFDVLVKPMSIRWGNYDTLNAAVQWNNAEVPASLDSYTGYQQQIGTGNGSTTTFTGTLSNTPCVYGTEIINVDTASALGLDQQANGTIAGSGVSSGSVNCTSGAVSVTFSSAPSNGTPIYVNYVVDSGNASSFRNAVPSNHIMPCSFFLAGYSATTCSSHPNGSTGLSWWAVCTSWTAFPTSCSTTQTQPFPPIGPDVTGGPYDAGYAYDIPAALAWQKLPIDPTYQNTYSITGSNWSGGVETLTISGPTTYNHILGGFQITGTAGCNSPAGGEFLMTGATNNGTATTSISYALASNPGSCAGGSVLFPDIRQFDERIYENDPGGTSGDPPTPLNPPTDLTATVE